MLVVLVVDVEVVVVVSGDVGKGIDSGPVPGLQEATKRTAPRTVAIRLLVAVTLLCTTSHRARSAA